MDGETLKSRIGRGMGAAARRVGTPYRLFRANGPSYPVAPCNKIAQLSAAFSPMNGSFTKPEPYGSSLWWGVFDTLFTRTGDYLRGADGTFFVAEQVGILPVQCVKANRTVTVSRGSVPAIGGYAGFVTEQADVLIQGWPACILADSAKIPGNLPDYRFGNWTVLLPQLPVELIAADIIEDDSGRCFVVAAAEQSDLGWRLFARETAG